MSLTIKALIARHTEREENKIKSKEIRIPSLGQKMLFYRPTDDDFIELMDVSLADVVDTRTMYEAFRKVIYNTCPMLKEPELQESLEIVDPLDVVKVLFTISDVLEVGSKLIEFEKISSVKVDKALKNSSREAGKAKCSPTGSRIKTQTT